MIITKKDLQRLINEEFSKALKGRKKRLVELGPRVADDDDVGGDMRGRCLACGAEEEDCSCGPEGGQPCPECGSENTEPLEPMPSMAGFGSDSGVHCLDCDADSWDTPSV